MTASRPALKEILLAVRLRINVSSEESLSLTQEDTKPLLTVPFHIKSQRKRLMPIEKNTWNCHQPVLRMNFSGSTAGDEVAFVIASFPFLYSSNKTEKGTTVI